MSAATLGKRTPDQLRASDPGAHVWVSASAGTGKTQVLTDRMLRLMLDGAAPDRILALTFTRAAASEMQTRLTATLGRWQAMDDATLAQHLAVFEGAVTPARLARARALFALALDLPGGLRVQTIHGFAQGLLSAFPLEAGLPPGFTALDERDSALLQRRALTESIVQAGEEGDRGFLEDLGAIAIEKGEGGLGDALQALLAASEGLARFQSAAAIAPAVRRLLGLREGETARGALEAVLDPAVHDDARLEAYAAAMAGWGKKTGLEAASVVRDWLAGSAAARADTLPELRKLFLLKNEAKFKKPPAAMPHLKPLIDDIARDILAIEAQQARFATADLAARYLRVGHRVAARYAALKRAAVAIDYDDMITRAAALLGQPGMPGWVAWKLDQRFDHLLVDEAQDTNQRQWAIIRRLSEDYFDAEDGTRPRTLFVVGDYKQAIFGFQGTDPEIFASEYQHVQQRAVTAGHAVDNVPLGHSFRSGPAVLELVDAFLADVGPAALGLAAPAPPHVPNRATAGSEVVLWPIVDPAGDDTDGEEDASQAAADRMLAERMARQISAWLRPGDPERLWLPGQPRADGTPGRWARPEDILILLRSRKGKMADLVAALHAERVPVAGVDRLLLTEPYAVLDLLALVRFALQPDDDLNLACLLVSPFLGWDHEAVRAISGPRKNSLWQALGLAAASNPAAAEARQWLGAALSMADQQGPFAFLDSILSGPLQGRQRLLARLGRESEQAIDELLLQALAFEQRHPPLLEPFLAWITAEELAVKREPDAVAAEVRLMTIHGAKGLQAPVVILADAAHTKKADNRGHVPARLDNSPDPVPIFFPATKPKAAGLTPALQADHQAREAADLQEDLRLLYVALTRAADHLFIAGAVGARDSNMVGNDKDMRWHSRIGRLLDQLPGVEQIVTPHFGPEAKAHRIRRGHWPAADPGETLAPAASRAAFATGLRLDMAPPPGRPARPLAPSAPDQPSGLAPALGDAARRGKWLHRLFELLPDVAPDQRRRVAGAWLERQGASSAAAAEMAETALGVIADPRFAALFGPDALAEAPIAGLIGDNVIAGTVDRLLIGPERILLVDFKTGTAVPERADAVAIPYLRQMAAYDAVLAQAFPHHARDVALLFTAAPKLILLDDKLLSPYAPGAGP